MPIGKSAIYDVSNEVRGFGSSFKCIYELRAERQKFIDVLRPFSSYHGSAATPFACRKKDLAA
jgi:hypothetical protein